MKHNHNKALNLLKTAKGQIDAVIKMTEDERYCVDISNQIMATIALLKKANLDILKNHLETCLRQSFEEGNEVEKVDEVIEVLKVYLK
jgi:CsoR family transcriptional regulator, copper-sensing transcriptional repressor